MNRYRFLSAMVVAAIAAAPLYGADVKSGVEVGKTVGTYSTTKCGGIDDGVKEGQSLCYTWRLGTRPVVFIFAKTPSDALASLVSKVDKMVAENEEKELAAVVNFIGEPTDDYVAQVKEFGEKHEIKNVALTVTKDADRFAVSDDAEITVMNYVGKKVAYNVAVDKPELSDEQIDEVLKSAEEMLKE